MSDFKIPPGSPYRNKHNLPQIHMIDDAVDNLRAAPDNQMSRRRLGDHPQGSFMWLTTFTDVMGLLLTFFVLMFAMSEPDNKEYDKITSSLRAEMGRVYGAQSNPGTEENIDLSRVNFNRALDVRYLEELIRNAIEGHEDLKDIEVIPQPGSVVLSLPQDTLFTPGEATIKEEGRKILYTLGGSLSRVRNRIEIDGHTGVAPREGASESRYGNNWELSLARAAQVAAILENVGYQQPVAIAGYAAGRYQDSKNADEGNAQDENARTIRARRVDITILNHSGKPDKIRTTPNILEGRP